MPTRRWYVIAWKLPLFVVIALASALLELVTTITWHSYIAADTTRDRFEQWWREFRRELPSWWERPET
jgi:hypothetical protein